MTKGELEDKVRELERRLQDVKRELDEAHDLVQRQNENVRDANELIETWIQAFEMVHNDEGDWVWSPAYVDGREWLDKYETLLREWNAAVENFNDVLAPRNVGRPLAASEAQVETVLKLRKQGRSLRWIVEETSLGLQTVRTIVDGKDRKDRTSRKYYERIKSDGTERAWRAKEQMRRHLPRRINNVRKTGEELRKEAKGLTARR